MTTIQFRDGRPHGQCVKCAATARLFIMPDGRILCQDCESREYLARERAADNARMDAEIGASIPANTPGSVRERHASDCLCAMCRAHRRRIVRRAARLEVTAA